jgi:hypothetical protein
MSGEVVNRFQRARSTVGSVGRTAQLSIENGEISVTTNAYSLHISNSSSARPAHWYFSVPLLVKSF